MRFYFIIFAILLFPIASALSIDVKDSYQINENIISPLNGNIAGQISESNVKLLRGHVEVAFEYDLKKLGDSYYIYGITPSTPNNYTLEIRNIPTTINGKLQTANITASINVTDELVPYYVRPGLILTQSDFEITLFSNKDSTEDIAINYPGTSSNYTAKPGENKLKFSINSFPPGLSTLEIGSYLLPVFLVKPEENNLEDEVIFFPVSIEKIVLVTEKAVFPIQIVNRGNSTLNVKLVFNERRLKITPEIDEIKPNSILNLEVTALDHDTLDEIIQITVGNQTYSLPLDISYTENKSEVTNVLSNNSVENKFYCSELNGVKCTSSQTCTGQNVTALDGTCCLAQCKTQTKSSSYVWIGYLVAMIVLIILVIILGRYMKSRKGGDAFSSRVRSVDRSIS